MRKYLRAVLSVLVMIGVVACSQARTPGPAGEPAAASGEVPRRPDGKPDLYGVWIQMRGTNVDRTGDADLKSANPLYRVFTDQPLPLQPWAVAKCNELPLKCKTTAADSSIADPELSGNDLADPYIANCMPPGFPRAMLSVDPLEIFQTHDGKRIVMRFEQYPGPIREIWMDGRSHPEYPDRPWMGHSTGRWEGDTLVVDTVGMHDITWLDRLGHPHSDALHVVERIHRPNGNTLRVDFLFDDPKAYTKPFTGQVTYEFRPNDQIREGVICEDRLLAESPEESWPFYGLRRK